MVVMAEELPFYALIKRTNPVMPGCQCGITGWECHSSAHARIEVTGPQKRTLNHPTMTNYCNALAGMTGGNGMKRCRTA